MMPKIENHTLDFETVSNLLTEKLNRMVEEEEKLSFAWEQKKFIAGLEKQRKITKQLTCKIAMVAPVSAGKSTLLNAICEYPILPAASGVTSSVPTYIIRIKEHSKESVTVYPLERKKINDDEEDAFEKSVNKGKTYKASDISETFFNELLSYLMLVMCGDGTEYATTIENVAYFMNSMETVDIEFNGYSEEKMALKKSDFALSYHVPRHRLLLLLVLLCVYVKQNEGNENKSEYKKSVNEMRKSLMKKYGFPDESDYCVFLEWCSDSIPEGVTLIDLPGTGADTKDSEKQSSHTKLVKGILYDADAIWVLSSDDGTVQSDLMSVIKDAIESDEKKSKVCIYNCKNNHPNDSTPIKDFIEKLPCLVGERCYVVNALAGEYQYIQNGIKAQHTKMASDRRYDDEEDTEKELITRLQNLYQKPKKAYPTYVTANDNGVIQVIQEKNVSYTLETFFKNALTDYVAKLKYEMILKEAVKHVGIWKQVKKELESTLEFLQGINGKGKEITNAVDKALEISKNNAMEKYTELMVQCQTKLASDLVNLSSEILPEIQTAFQSDYVALIVQIHKEWKTLITKGHENGMETNVWGNYPLKGGHLNWTKFTRVRENVDKIISITAFQKAMGKAEDGIGKYRLQLEEYVSQLKKATKDFRNDYLYSFLTEYEKQRDANCKNEKGEIINDVLWQNFNSAKQSIEIAIFNKMSVLHDEICDSFEILIKKDGKFDSVCNETNKSFKEQVADKVLDGLRSDIRCKLTEANETGWFKDRLDIEMFNKLLLNDFTGLEKECEKQIESIVSAVYGNNLNQNSLNKVSHNSNQGGLGIFGKILCSLLGIKSTSLSNIFKKKQVNFPQEISDTVNRFNADVIQGSKGAVNKSEKVHRNIIDIVGLGAGLATDVSGMIKEVEKAIKTWGKIGRVYIEVGNLLITEGSENIQNLSYDYKGKLIETNDEAKSIE